jgi:hypothetical protein
MEILCSEGLTKGAEQGWLLNTFTEGHDRAYSTCSPGNLNVTESTWNEGVKW